MAIYRNGMDAVAVRGNADRLQALSVEFDAVATAVDRCVVELKSSWGGGDFEHLARNWQSQRVRVASCGESLSTMAGDIRRNVGAQDATSAADSGSFGGALATGAGAYAGGAAGAGGVGASVGSPGGAAIGAEGQGHQSASELYGGPDERTGDLDLALISRDVYEHGYALGGEDVKGENGTYEKLTPGEIEALGLDPELFTGGVASMPFALGIPGLILPGQSGATTSIYRDDHGNYVLAFAGTDDFSDVQTDIMNAAGLPTVYYQYATEVAQKVQQALGPEADNLVITGHSMGGGMATVASIATGAPAVTYNAAGPGVSAVSYAADQAGITPKEAKAAADAGNIRAYHVEGDAVTSLSGPGLAPPAWGTSIVLDTPQHKLPEEIIEFTGDEDGYQDYDALDAHGMDTVVDSMVQRFLPPK